MVWLKSTSQKEWVINGKIIPRCVTKDNAYLKVTDSDYNKMISQPVFKSLVNSSAVLVLHQEPSEIKNSIQGLSSSNAELVAKNTELQARIAELEKSTQKVDIEAVKAEAVASIKEEAVKELQEKQNALDEATAEIKKLRKQLAKASKSE